MTLFNLIKFTSSSKGSLRDRRLKGKEKGDLGKGVLGARETRGAREGGVRRGTPARKPLFLPSRLLIKKITKITQLWMTSCQISLAAMHVF